MSWKFLDDTPWFLDHDGKLVLRPSYALSSGVNIIHPELARCLADDLPLKEWKNEFSDNHKVMLIPGCDFFHRGIGSNNDIGGVSTMDLRPRYASNYPTGYEVPDQSFEIPMAPSAAGGVSSMGQPSSYAWKKASSHWVPIQDFEIPPMTHSIASKFSKGLSPMDQKMVCSWSDATRYGVPNHDFVVTNHCFEVPYGGSRMPDFSYEVHENLRAHKTFLTTNGTHNLDNQLFVTKGETQQEQRKPNPYASIYGGKKRDVAKLLEGFTVIEEVRRGGKSIGHKDKYYIHAETGKRLRSLQEVERFKLTGNPKKPNPITNATTSIVTNLGQPPEQLLQLPTQQLASSSDNGGTENASDQIPKLHNFFS